MSHNHIIRTGKDEAYRLSLSEEEGAKLPQNLAQDWEELDEQMMEALAGGSFRAGGSFGTFLVGAQSPENSLTHNPWADTNPWAEHNPWTEEPA